MFLFKAKNSNHYLGAVTASYYKNLKENISEAPHFYSQLDFSPAPSFHLKFPTDLCLNAIKKSDLNAFETFLYRLHITISHQYLRHDLNQDVAWWLQDEKFFIKAWELIRKYHDELLFSSLSLPPLDKESVVKFINQLDQSYWHFDKFRNTWNLPMRTRDGQYSQNSTVNKGDTHEYHWTTCAPPEVRVFFEKHIFPWSTSRCRVVVLRTPPGQETRDHVDCSKKAFGSLQHKFRLVLQGRTDSLFFLTRDGKVYAPPTDQPFIIDGGWPHGMKNDSTEDKLTLCLGAPWETRAGNYPYGKDHLSQKNLTLPAELDQYFEENHSL